MTSIRKALSEQTLLSILENCKQIPKDDRLFLRKLLKEGDNLLIQILSDQYHKKLQVRLRKYLTKQKQNRKVSTPYLKKQSSSQSIKKLSAQKNPNPSRQIYRELMQFKQNISSENNRRINTLLQDNNNKFIYPQVHKTYANSPKQALNKNDLFTRPQLLLQCQNFLNSSKIKIFKKQQIKQSLQRKSPPIEQFKKKLMNVYAEDIFDYIVQKYFPEKTHELSIYLPYKKLFKALQALLFQTSLDPFQNYQKELTILPPFRNQFQGVTLESLGKFIDLHCLKKPNKVRDTFVLLQDLKRQNYLMGYDKFCEINRWKGDQICRVYKLMASQHFSSQQISYWDLYKKKNEKIVTEFIQIYER